MVLFTIYFERFLPFIIQYNAGNHLVVLLRSCVGENERGPTIIISFTLIIKLIQINN